MNAENEQKTRKELRIKQYDYSARGAYFITICAKDRKTVFSNIARPVGVGALDDPWSSTPESSENYGVQVRLTKIGEIVKKHLLSSENIAGVTIDRYVIMPDHIHAIVILEPEKYVLRRGGSSRAPTPTNEMLPHVVSTFKRFCNKELGDHFFQRGYMEHIIRDREDYETRCQYIYENPIRWYYKKDLQREN